MDEYVRRAYKFAYSDCIEVGPLASLPEPPDPNELYPRQSRRQALTFLAFSGYTICVKQLNFNILVFNAVASNVFSLSQVQFLLLFVST